MRVSWIDEAREKVYDFRGRDVVYLGRAHGIAVFYDPANEQTVQVPDSTIVIERAS